MQQGHLEGNKQHKKPVRSNTKFLILDILGQKSFLNYSTEMLPLVGGQ